MNVCAYEAITSGYKRTGARPLRRTCVQHIVPSSKPVMLNGILRYSVGVGVGVVDIVQSLLMATPSNRVGLHPVGNMFLEQRNRAATHSHTFFECWWSPHTNTQTHSQNVLSRLHISQRYASTTSVVGVWLAQSRRPCFSLRPSTLNRFNCSLIVRWAFHREAGRTNEPSARLRNGWRFGNAPNSRRKILVVFGCTSVEMRTWYGQRVWPYICLSVCSVLCLLRISTCVIERRCDECVNVRHDLKICELHD